MTVFNKPVHDIKSDDQERDPDLDAFVHSTMEDNRSPVGKVWEHSTGK